MFDATQLSRIIEASPKLRATIARKAAEAVVEAPVKASLRPEEPSEPRLQILSFTESERDGLFDDQNQTPLTCRASPQRPFRAEKLIITSTDPTVPLEIRSIKVGSIDQTINAGGGQVPIDVFRPDSVGTRLQLDPAQVGNIVAVEIAPTVTLVAGQVTVCRVVMLGTSLT